MNALATASTRQHAWMRRGASTSFAVRLWLMSGLFVLMLGGLCAKLMLLSLRTTHVQVLSLPDDRRPQPTLHDRRGRLIAGNLATFSLYADARRVRQAAQTARRLAALFPELNVTQLEKRLRSTKRFVWIKRHITPKTRRAFLKLGLPGVFVKADARRHYPQGQLFSHVIGLTDIDGRPLTGLEKGFAGQRGKVVTSLDARLQHAMRDELKKAASYFSAKAGNALLVHVPTGEIRAMVSWPDFNANAPTNMPISAGFNRNVTGVYEFGSVLKLHNVAMALEQEVTHLNESFDASKPLKFGRFLISDFRGKGGQITLQEAFLRSSNIVNAKVAMNAGVKLQKAFFKRLGFFERIQLEVPESAQPLMPKLWGDTTLATASYGYGLALTPLHLAQSVATLCTGYDRPLTLFKQHRVVKGRRVLRPQTAKAVRLLLRQSALQGHARKADVPGYDVGAKTGTANQLVDGKYKSRQNLVTCVSVFPMKKPEYILVVSLEHPEPRAETCGYVTAGWIAAPTAKALTARLAPLLGLAPQPMVHR